MHHLVWPSFGVHPWQAPDYVNRLEDLREVISQSPILGEIGLDHQFVEDTSQYPAQREVFEFFLAAAKEQDKIVNLHTKGAEREVFDLLERYDISRVIVHWYSGPLQVLHKLAERGIYFTVGVEILYSDDIKAVALELPMELLLTETDNPGGLKWLTGTPGMPLVVRDVVGALAELRGTSVEEAIQTVQSNFERLMGDDPHLSKTYAEILEEQPDGAQ
jgi:TatD DNase family protein